MSATDYFQPHVYIGGVKLNESRGLHGLTPVADISIKWGARDWYGEIDPSTVRMIILDPYGALLKISQGATVKITRDPDNRVMFAGSLDEATFTHTTRRAPDGTDITLWEVEITAFDALGLMAGDRAHGPTYIERNGQQNTLHWGRSLIRERFADLASRCPIALSWTYATYWKSVDDAAAMPPTAIYPVAPYTTQQNVSVLHVLRKSARILHILNRPYVDHHAGRVRFARPPIVRFNPTTVEPQGGTADALTLNRVTHESSVIVTVPASTLEATGDLRLKLSPDDYLTYARTVQRREELKTPDTGSGFWGTHYEVIDAYGHTVSIWRDRESVSSIEIETDLSAGYEYGDYFLDIADLIEFTRTWQTLPPFRVRIGKENTPDNFLAVNYFLRAQPYTNVHYPEQHQGFAIVGSPLQWGGSIPHFAVVGGELRYTAKHGWVVECNPAPIPTRSDSTKTLGDFPAVTARLDAAHPDLLVGDFQLI